MAEMAEHIDDIICDQEEIRVLSNEEDVEYLDSGLRIVLV